MVILLSCDDKGSLPVETRHVSMPMRMARVMAMGRMKRPILRREKRPIAILLGGGEVLFRRVPILEVLEGHEEVFFRLLDSLSTRQISLVDRRGLYEKI